MRRLFSTLFPLQRGEAVPVLLAAGFFFCVLNALMILRPAREALGMQGGLDAVRWLFIGTALATLLVNPVFGWLVARFRRLQFIAATYLFFAASLVGFYLLLKLGPGVIGVATGQVFYVWFSVFNLFATMVFWALMADRHTLEQSKRYFGPISVGGTLGAICGPWLASVLVRPLGTANLLLISVGFLLLALLMAWAILRRAPGEAGHLELEPQGRIGGGAWAGVQALLRSRYLSGIALYVIILAIMATFLYFTRLQMVAAQVSGLDTRTMLFARIDVWTQVATLLMQLMVAGPLMRRLGVPLTLALLPLTASLGFLGLALSGTLVALVLFEAAFRAVQRAVMRPARETLFTVLDREEKYKAKAFIDTFVYRLGDVAGAQFEGLLGRLAMGLAALASAAIPLALAWAVLGVWLGRAQRRRALQADAALPPATPPAADPSGPPAPTLERSPS